MSNHPVSVAYIDDIEKTADGLYTWKLLNPDNGDVLFSGTAGNPMSAWDRAKECLEENGLGESYLAPWDILKGWKP